MLTKSKNFVMSAKRKITAKAQADEKPRKTQKFPHFQTQGSKLYLLLTKNRLKTKQTRFLFATCKKQNTQNAVA